MWYQTLTEFVLVGVLLTTAKPAWGFVLSDSQCAVPAPCTCNPTMLACQQSNLTDIPTVIINNPSDQSVFKIQLDGNGITSIPDNAFINISFVHPAVVEISLKDNMIVDIEQDAFKGVENTTQLDLGGNRLTGLPSALGTLNRLQKLDLTRNPISKLDPAIVSLLGRSLKQFLVNVQAFKTLPTGLKSLHRLEGLQLQNAHFKYLPVDIFDEQSSSLLYLQIDNATLPRIPNICHLQELRLFRIILTSSHDVSMILNRRSNDSNVTWDVQCSQPLQHLTGLTVDGGGLGTFPDVFLSFPSLENLELNNHGFQSIPSNMVPQMSALAYLSLANNSFSRIPSALNNLVNLTNLDLAENQISTVENSDLIGLTSLGRLTLSNNPITHIAPDAFKHNSMLTRLYLDHTKLHLIPEAISSLSHISEFYFRGNDAECSCRLSYLKGLNLSGVFDFAGICNEHQNDTILTYVSKYLPSCP